MTLLPLNIPTGRRFDVAGFGTNAVDHLITVPTYPHFNSKVEIADYRMMAGGEVASTLVGLQRLGFATAYAGRFGDDPEGELGQRSLDSEGVDISFTQVVSDARTQIAYIVIDSATGERTVMWHRDAALKYTAADAPVDVVGDCRILHMTPHDTAACIQMANAARDAGTIVSLDLDNDFDGLRDLLPLVDVCIISSDFPERFFGDPDRDKALAYISDEIGCAIVGVTLGLEGSRFYMGDGEYLVTPAYPVPGRCVDTTGAGDAFRAGFLYGLLSGMSIGDAARAANKVASLKCRGLGARSALPTLEEITRLKKQ